MVASLPRKRHNLNSSSSPSCRANDRPSSRTSDHRHPTKAVEDSSMGMARLGFTRRRGLLAVLMFADRSRTAEAFVSSVKAHSGGAAVRSSVSGRCRPNASDGLGGRRREQERRSLLRPRNATLAPATDSGSSELLRKGCSDGSEAPRVEINGAANSRLGRRRGAQDEADEDQDIQVSKHPPESDNSDQASPRLLGEMSRATQQQRTGILGLRELNSKRIAVDSDVVRRSVMHYMEKPKALTGYQFLSLGMASARHCDIHLVMQICETARSLGVTTDVRFMTNLVHAASKKNRWVMASELLMLMRLFGVEPNDITYTCVLSEMSKAKQHHMATEMLRTEGLGQRLFAYNALISGCTSSTSGRSYDYALEYFNDMLKAQVQPDCMTFSCIIATGRDGSDESVERAFGTLELMQEYGVKPSTYCMNTVMAVSVQARQPNTALEVFKEMERKGIARDVVSYNTAIKACDSLGEASAAVRLLQEAREASIVPDEFSYNSVISALGHSSMWQEAMQLFEEMHDAGVEPSTMTYNTVISACVRAEQPAEALEVFRSMSEKNINRDQYTCAGVLHACLQLRDVDQSVKFIAQMEESGVPANAQAYATAIRTCARCGDCDQAVALYGRSLAIGRVPSKLTYTCLLEALSEAKSAERANWVLDEMDEMQVQADEGHLVLVMSSCTGETEIALRVLRIHDELGFEPSESLYKAALEVCIAACIYDDAVEVVNAMAAVGMQPEMQQEKRMIQSCPSPSIPKAERRKLEHEENRAAEEAEEAARLQG